jgi:hypothetical protein
MAKIGKDEQRFRDFYKVLSETKQRYLKKYGKQGVIQWHEKVR